MIFELMIWIYLFTKKKRINLFSQFHLYSISKKKLFTLIVSKEFITKFQFGYKNYFYLLLLENNEFLQFYLQKYLDSFSFKKVIYTNYLKWHNFICKRIFN